MAADVCGASAGVRALQDQWRQKPEPAHPPPVLAGIANGSGGFVTLYGGKLTTHRAFAEECSTNFATSALISVALDHDVPLYGGGESAPSSLLVAKPGNLFRADLPPLGFTTDQIERLYAKLLLEPNLSRDRPRRHARRAGPCRRDRRRHDG
jgi:glycerol-3-phosphate dehydrogenase